jgi:hypothetical protein
MAVVEVEGIEGVGWGIMSLIWLWKAVKKLKRARCGGQLRTDRCAALRYRKPAFYRIANL